MSNPDGAFNPTQWSIVLLAADSAAGDTRHHDALQSLCSTYWKPLYVFARRNGSSPQDAEDLVQSFISSILEHGALKTVDKSKGKFRSFLLASLKNFIANDFDHRTALKRGGAFTFVSAGSSDAEDLYQLEDPDARNPDELFDRSWALNTITAARARTRDEYQRAKKLDRFEKFQPFLPGASEPETPDAAKFEALAQQLDMRPDTVKVEIHRLRRRFGIRLREVVAETLADPSDLDSELRYLISAVSTTGPPHGS